MLDSDASTAKTLTLVAVILQAVFFLIGLVAVFFVAAIFVAAPGAGAGFLGIGALSLFFPISFVIGILWIILDYFLVYKNLAQERVRDAETPSIVLGIIQLIFGGFIPGILLIIAYVKIRDSLQRNPSSAAQNLNH